MDEKILGKRDTYYTAEGRSESLVYPSAPLSLYLEA